MAIDDLDLVRLKIADRVRQVISEIVGTGDATETFFRVVGHPVVDGSQVVMVNGALQVETTDYTFDDALGLLTFVAAPALAAVITVSYQWSVFSDEELDNRITATGSVNGATAEAIRWLLADTDRFIKYTFGQETVDRTATREGLENLLARLEKTAGPVGLVLAETDALVDLMEPFIEQVEASLDAIN